MIKLKNFTELNSQEIELIFKWRNHPDINQFMKTKQIDFEEHLRFIRNLHQDSNKKYFLVFQDEQIIGVIDFVNITTKSCEFGLYAKPDLKGVGQILMNEILKYAFEILKIDTLKAYVFKNNHKALKLYQQNHFTIYDEDKNIFYIKLKNYNYKKQFAKRISKLDRGGVNTNIKNILMTNFFKITQYNIKNKNIVFLMQDYRCNILLKNYTNLNYIEKEKIRKYRNHPEVKKYLYQTHFISKLEHKNFIKKLKYNTKKSYFCVILDNQIIGNINFYIRENEIDFGFYANPFSKILGIGRILEQISIYYAFKIINVPILSLEIFSNNTQVINLHRKFGFSIVQEFFIKKQKILKMSLKQSDCKTLLS